MKIFIDADGCPVVDNTIKIAKKNNIEVTLICDTSHVFDKSGANTITVSKGADSADYAIVNMLARGDVVVTQDYGLAAMCLARSAAVISQDGMEYTNENIDSLLLFRHTAREIRNGGGRLKGNPKRNREVQDKKFEEELCKILQRKEV